MLKRPSQAAAGTWRPSGRPLGFSLIELLIVLALASLLATLVYPSYAEQWRRGHRGEAIARLAELQQRQERWRSNQPSYASLEQLGQPAEVPGARYRYAIDDAGPGGYRAQAEARGTQAADTACRWLEVEVRRGQARYRSGSAPDAGNAPAQNDRCWQR